MIKINLGKIKLSMNLPPPPPPPPTSPKSRKKLFMILAVVLIAIILIPSVLIFSGALKFGPSNPTSTPTATPTNSPVTSPGVSTSPTTHNTVSVASGAKTQVASQTIDSAGGTIQVTDSSSPLNGLQIVVPEAATSDPVQFQVSYADISNVNGLPQGATPASELITIQTSGSAEFNKYEMFDNPVQVTLPYSSTVPNDDNSPVRFYWYDSQAGKLDSTGFLSEDKSAHTITFLTASFSDFLAVEVDISLSELTGTSYTVDTGFRPATNGWFIPNYGSVLTPGGMCLGMVSYAKWFYTYHSTDTGLHAKYIQGDAAEWRDDATAIQLAARAHLGTTGVWSSLTNEEKGWARANAREVGLSWLSGMLVTGEPQIIGLKTVLTNGTYLDGSHAILTYGYSDGSFQIYDPNYPGSSPSDRARLIPFTYTSGFNETYISGTTRASGEAFNIFYHAGSKLAATPDDYQGLYDAAQTGFQDNSKFPTVTLTDTSTTPTGTTPTDTDSDGIRDTTDSKTTISGTITGGEYQINSTLIFVDNHKYMATVTDGVFSQEVPLLAGENDVVILATDQSTFYNWAGYLKDTIKSTASPAALTVTLTWDQDTSDVDLHVLEPGTDARHIYWSNTGSGSNNPYLDFDNTHGFGPEHYIAAEDSTIPGSTNIYGTYQIRVEYYADHSGADTPQAITWHLNVKYLAFKDQTTGQEYWVQESRSGALSTPSSSGTGDFESSGPAWSEIWTIQYNAPDPTAYGVPPPPQNVFPT
jgi:uncharacterized protein YfaP (DUF2135 family)